MRKLKCLYFVFISVVGYSMPLNLNAQTLSVEANSESGVSNNGTFHTLAGDINFDFTFDEKNDSVTEVQNASYRFGVEEGTIKYSLDKGKVSLYAVKLSGVTSSKASMDFSSSLYYLDADEVQKSVNSNVIQVMVWDTPTSSLEGEETVKTSGFAKGLSWSVSHSGGYSQGWTTEWTYEGKTIKDDSFILPTIMNSSSIDKTINITVKITNIAPDGKTIWYESSRTIKVTVTPVLLKQVTESIDGFSGKKAIAEVKYESSQELQGLDFYWTLDSDEEVKTSKPQYEFALPENTDKYFKSSSLKVYLANDDKSVKSNEVRIPVKTYSLGKVTPKSFETTDFFDGDVLTLTLNVEGGYPDGWTYTWYDNGTKLSGTSSYIIVPLSNKTSEKITHNYSVRATNMMGDVTGFDQVIEFPTITVWHLSLQPVTKSISGYSTDQAKAVVENDAKELTGCYYYWKLDSGAEVKTDEPSYQFALPENTASFAKSSTLTVCFANEDKSVKSNEVRIPISTYSKGTVAAKALGETDYLDGKTVSLALDVEGGYPDGWTYVWYDNGNQIDGDNYNNTIALENKTLDKITHVFTVEVTNKIDSQIGYNEVITFPEVSVWPTPSASFIGDEKVEAYGVAENLSWSVDCKGGYADGWDVVWTYDGKKYSSKNFTMPRYENTKSTSAVIAVSVSATNYAPDGKTIWGNTLTKTIIVNVTPYPTVEIPTDIISGFSKSEISVKGSTNGYPQGSVWNFAWTIDGEETVYTSKPECKLKLPTVEGAEDLKTTLTVVASNNLTNNIKNNIIKIPVTVYSLGYVTTSGVDTTQVKSGSMVKLNVLPYGGNPSGWTYIWKDNGKEVFRDDNIYQFEASNKGKSAENHLITVHVKNVIGTEVGYEGDVSFNQLTVWPEPVYPTTVRMIDRNRGVELDILSIREGNLYSLISQTASGGYIADGSWTESWQIGEEGYNYAPTLTAKSNSKTSSKDISYTVVLALYQNFGPYSRIWSSDYVDDVIAIYSKPKTPNNLSIMGNGSTCTLIASYSTTDDDLRNKEYYLVFGYEDSNGDHNNNPVRQDVGTSRFDSFTSSVFNNPSNKFYVFALWIYEDGTQITSGKRYLDGTLNDEWDGSEYNNKTRSPYISTDIKDAEFKYSDSEIEAVYSLDGQLLSSPKRGFNIIKMRDGTVRKVVIK